jgi:ComF family protein
LRLASVYPLGTYEGLRRETVLQMKQAEYQTLAVHVGRLLGWRLQQRWRHGARPDAIAPIPKHWLRRWWRGTNSAECLAEGISRVWRVPWVADLLALTRLTDKQSLLSQTARRKNLRNALAVRPRYEVTGRTILLVDDLMTTGTTGDEAARMLLRAGASAVHMAVVCRA